MSREDHHYTTPLHEGGRQDAAACTTAPYLFAQLPAGVTERAELNPAIFV
jgi:hypothetical protein